MLQVHAMRMSLRFFRITLHPGILAIESSAGDPEALPPAICFKDSAGCRIAFAALPVRDFGVAHARPLGAAGAVTRIFLQTPLFNYVAAAGALLDELCWGCGCNFSADLENALIQMVIAVGEDLEAAVQRTRPMLSLVAGAAQESDHMLFQMKKDVAAALENDHRSLAVGRLHQFLDQLLGNGCDMAMLMSLPQSFKDAAAAFFAAKTACMQPTRFRLLMRTAHEAATQLHAHIMSTPAASLSQPPPSLMGFISASANAPSDDGPLTAAEPEAAALLKPKLLGPRTPSLLFMPVLSIEDIQARRFALPCCAAV